MLKTIKYIFYINLILLFFSACSYNKYYNYSIESLKVYDDKRNFKRLQKFGNLEIIDRDSLINIKLSKRTLAFQDLNDKTYHVFIYHTKELNYEKYICDSNKIVLKHMFHAIIY